MPDDSGDQEVIGTSDIGRACYEYLGHKPCILWGHTFNVKDESSRREAAEWLSDQVTSVLLLVGQHRSGAVPYVTPGTGLP